MQIAARWPPGAESRAQRVTRRRYVGTDSTTHFLARGVRLNLNLVVVTGALAVAPNSDSYLREESARLLLTVRSDGPNSRVDLLPVTAFVAQLPDRLTPGDKLWVVGSLQRRFSAATGRSRLEIVAHEVERQPAL